MNANFVSKKYVITDDIKAAFLKKFKKFDKFFPENTEITAAIKDERGRARVEITITDRGYFYRAEETADDPITALDSCMSAMERQIRKHKTKLEKRFRAGAFNDLPVSEDTEEEPISVAKVKKFLYKPMTVEEAILQMDFLGHQFYVFKNVENEAVCVVYKRNDGKYGVIEPIE